MIGEMLRHERELRGISLEEIARTTRIPLATLRAIEADDWDAMPGEVFAKGFVRSYSEALGLDPRPLLKRFESRETGRWEARTFVARSSRGRRLGVALAIAMLVALFILALSVVLRPRRRSRPVELSWEFGSPATQVPRHGEDGGFGVEERRTRWGRRQCGMFGILPPILHPSASEIAASS